MKSIPFDNGHLAPGSISDGRRDPGHRRIPAAEASAGPGEPEGPPPLETDPTEREKPGGDILVEPDVPWIVLVWNAPINLMSYVTFVFQKLFGYSVEKATELMLDVHEKGRAVVSNGSREKCELDVFRLHEHGLWATMQKDD